MKVGAPVIGLNDSGGARIQEGVASLGGYADIFLRNVLASGRRPADLGDHGTVRRRRRVLPGHDRLHRDGGGDELHVRHGTERREGGHPRGRRLGAARRRDHPHDGERCRPSRRQGRGAGARRDPPDPRVPAPEQPVRCAAACRPPTRSIGATRSWTRSCPDDPQKPYDMHGVIDRIVDDGRFLEIQPGWAANIIVGFGRLGGRSVGIVAQQPAVLAGALDINSSIKAARFVRTCDCFNVPLITFVDVPASCRESPRSTAGSSSTARSCSTRIARRPCPS